MTRLWAGFSSCFSLNATAGAIISFAEARTRPHRGSEPTVAYGCGVLARTTRSWSTARGPRFSGSYVLHVGIPVGAVMGTIVAVASLEDDSFGGWFWEHGAVAHGTSRITSPHSPNATASGWRARLFHFLLAARPSIATIANPPPMALTIRCCRPHPYSLSPSPASSVFMTFPSASSAALLNGTLTRRASHLRRGSSFPEFLTWPWSRRLVATSSPGRLLCLDPSRTHGFLVTATQRAAVGDSHGANES